MSEKVRTKHLECKAILYVRQSSPYQVIHNLESQKLQYAMAARLRQLGWREIEVIDEDLGRSAAGAVTRAGFEGMVAEALPGSGGRGRSRRRGSTCARFQSRDAKNQSEACRKGERASSESVQSSLCTMFFPSIGLRPAWSRGSISKTHRQPQGVG